MPDTAHAPNWEHVERMVGLPDYGVAFCLSPWPDGGWLAGVVITNRDWVAQQAEEGHIDPAMLAVPENTQGWTWDLFDGFADGINAHGDDAADAIDVLWAKIHGDPNPPRRHQRTTPGASP